MQLIEKVIPGIEVARIYQGRCLRADLIAGVTIFIMLVPQGMAYGKLAGVAVFCVASIGHSRGRQAGRRWK